MLGTAQLEKIEERNNKGYEEEQNIRARNGQEASKDSLPFQMAITTVGVSSFRVAAVGFMAHHMHLSLQCLSAAVSTCIFAKKNTLPPSAIDHLYVDMNSVASINLSVVA